MGEVANSEGGARLQACNQSAAKTQALAAEVTHHLPL